MLMDQVKKIFKFFNNFQLIEIKEELKQTRNERDLFRKKYNESITLQDGKKNEIMNILRSAVEKLILELTLT